MYTYLTIVLNFVLVIVPIYEKKDNGRNYSKTDHCYYCNKVIGSKISKHLLKMHTDRVAVQEIIQSSGEHRGKLLYKLQQLGNYKHNTEVYWSILAKSSVKHYTRSPFSTNSVPYWCTEKNIVESTIAYSVVYG